MKRNYCSRWLQPLLQSKTASHPAVVVTGARQVGKTTLLRQEFPDWNYLTLDDYDVLDTLKNESHWVFSSKQPLILDEVQRYPELFYSIKKTIDDKSSSRFILSGSANLLLMEKVSESLAGRAVFLELGPLTQGEILGHPPSTFLEKLFQGNFSFTKKKLPICEELAFKVWHGGMPQIYQRENPQAILEWFEGYIATYLEKDLRQLSQISYLADFRQLMIASALRCGSLSNLSEIGRDIGLTQPTTQRYMNLLEISGLVFRLPAYAVNRGKRLVKAPKMLWIDTGLASYLAGHYTPEHLKNSREWGGILESFIFHHLKQLTSLITPRPHIYYWRTSSGQEVDFVIEQGQNLIGIEVKSSQRVHHKDIEALKQFLMDYPQTKAGIVLYTGQQIEQLAENIFAIPLSILWEKN